MSNMKLILTEPFTELKDIIELWISPTESQTIRGEVPFVGKEYPGQPRIRCHFGQKEIKILSQVNMYNVNTCCFFNKEKEGRLIVIGWFDDILNLHKSDTLIITCRWYEVDPDKVDRG